MRDLDKFRGCLIGGAIGDALGYAVEFKKIWNITEEYGPNGITRYDLFHGVARISDDTQMTLFTAVGLLFGMTRGKLRGIGGNGCGFIHNAYAVTGNILGAFLGYEALPDFYVRDLELKDLILEVAEDLYHDCQMSEYSDYSDPVWESKYLYLDYAPGKEIQ